MKTVGLIGGMSWESTAEYYRLINRGVAEKLGGLHSAQILLLSVDFAQVAQLQSEGRWDDAGELLADAAYRLQQAGADVILLCTNTMHKVARQIEARIDVPFVHIAESTANAIRAEGITRVALLGTRFTMEQSFYKNRLAEQGIEVMIPGDDAREVVHQVIYDELCQGIVRDVSRQRYVDIIHGCVAKGAQAVVLGCTEIGLLLPADGSYPWPVFDTTRLHAADAVAYAMQDEVMDYVA